MTRHAVSREMFPQSRSQHLSSDVPVRNARKRHQNTTATTTAATTSTTANAAVSDERGARRDILVRCEVMFDLAELYPETSHLDDVVGSANERDRSVAHDLHPVTSVIQSRSSSTSAVIVVVSNFYSTRGRPITAATAAIAATTVIVVSAEVAVEEMWTGEMKRSL